MDFKLCQLYGCTPKELDEQNADTLAVHYAILDAEMKKKHPKK